MLPVGIFSPLTNLTYLNLSETFPAFTALGQHLPVGVFNGLTSLTTLDLSRNALNALEANLFAPLTNLTELNLFASQLNTLQPEAFNGLTSLTTLYLGRNAFTTLDATAFDALTNLRTLDLSFNDLEELPAGIFSDLDMLTGVDVSGNPQDDSPALPLTAIPKEISPGMAVVEVAQGVPFTSVTATVSISGGTFSNGTLSSTETQVTISKGQTTSAAFEYTADPTEIATVIAVSNLISENILDGFDNTTLMGYSGFQLASGDPLTFGDGVCNRTLAVQTAILEMINGDPDRPDPAVTCNTVTNALLAEIQILTFLSGQTIASLQSGDFAGLTNLTKLVLENNGLTTLPADIFSSLEKLETLDLSGNELTDLSDQLFSGLTALEGADFSGNPASDPADLVLTLSIQITEIQNQFVVEVAQGAPTDLRVSVRITGGTFSESSTTATTTISTGTIRSGPITVIPTHLGVSPVLIVTTSETFTAFDTTNAFNGNTGYSGLTIVAPVGQEFRLGICDRTLQVQNVILSAINNAEPPPDPEVTCSAVTLAQLARITVPLTLSGLTEELRVGDFEGLSGVTELALLQNGFTSLPDGIFSDLNSLISLDLASNELTSVSARLFAGLTSLTSLELGVNQLSDLDANTFSSLSGLTKLGLTGNDLVSLDGDAFTGLSALETLDLSDNDLMELPPEIFSDLENTDFNGLTNLTTLDLSSNQLRALPSGIFSGLEMLTGVDASGQREADGITMREDPLPLTVTLQETGQGTAVVEVAQGVPFEFTATVEITGGTFFSDTRTTVAISKGNTQSEPFVFTLNQSTPDAAVPEATISITNTSPTETEIDNDFDLILKTGYGGFTFDLGPDLRRQMGICSRTDEVEAAILEEINSVTPPPDPEITCTTVTDVHLTGITELDLSDRSIATLMPDDFAGLSGLRILDLSDNVLLELPSGVFSDLIGLETLDLSGNRLMSLPEGMFAGLMMLTGVNMLGNNPPSTPSVGLFTNPPNTPGLFANPPNPAAGLFTLVLVLRKTEEDKFVIEVAEGAPTDLTATVTIQGGTVTDMNGQRTATPEIVIPTGMTESQKITVEPASNTMVATVTLMSTTTLTSFNNGTGHSGFNIEASDETLTFTFEAREQIDGVEERIERVGESILPTVSRELISGIQNVISGRIGRLTTTPVVASPTAQIAGQSTLSDLLTFTAQTFDRVHNQDQNFALETLLRDSSFSLSLNGEEGNTSRTGFESIAVWGSVDYQNVSGGDDISWDGSITSFHIGSDMRVTRKVLGGVSLSWSRGMFDYEDSTSGVSQEGEYELELLSIHPYGGWSPVPWFNLWATGGYGFGEVTVTDNMMTGSQSSDVQSYSGSLGASAERDLEENSVFPGITTLRVKGQTSIATMEVEDNGDMISSVNTEAYQQRVSVEVSHTSGVNQERYFIPTLEVGVRNDGGDGETGNGLEIGGDVEYRAIDLGLRVSVNGRWLAVHSGELEEWGVGGSIRFEPGARGGEGQGFWMSITPEWGETSSRAGALWDAKIEDVERASQEREARLGAEAGYGLGIGKALFTPSAGVSLTNQGYRSYRVGSGVVMGEFSLTLEGERRSMRSASLEESVTLEGSLRF